jgi:hypothetical protein
MCGIYDRANDRDEMQHRLDGVRRDITALENDPRDPTEESTMKLAEMRQQAEALELSLAG